MSRLGRYLASCGGKKSEALFLMDATKNLGTLGGVWSAIGGVSMSAVTGPGGRAGAIRSNPNGGTKRVQLDALKTIPGTGNYTYCVWLRYLSGDVYYKAPGIVNGSNQNVVTTRISGDGVNTGLTWQTDQSFNSTSKAGTAFTWNFVLIRGSRSATQNVTSTYFKGSWVSTNLTTNNNPYAGTSARPAISADVGSTSYCEAYGLAYYNRQLSDAEVTYLYNAGSGRNLNDYF